MLAAGFQRLHPARIAHGLGQLGNRDLKRVFNGSSGGSDQFSQFEDMAWRIRSGFLRNRGVNLRIGKSLKGIEGRYFIFRIQSRELNFVISISGTIVRGIGLVSSMIRRWVGWTSFEQLLQ